MTTYAYKQAMSDIAANVANINAQKVQLNQQQQELDQNWAQFQESIRQYEKDFAEQQRQFGLNYELNKKSTQAQYDSSIYERLVDMLGRYNTVTPEMANLGAQVGMNLSVGSSTSNYLTEAERLANNQAIYGQVEGAGNQYYYDQYQLSNLSNSILPIVQASGKIGNSAQFATLLSKWLSEGVSATEASNIISKGKYSDASGNEIDISGIVGKSWGAKEAAIDAAFRILDTTGTQYQNYLNSFSSIFTSPINLIHAWAQRNTYEDMNNYFRNNR